ncbi:MAG: hypothetical protein ACKOSS_04910, partial [Planctomycetia bacterium]
MRLPLPRLSPARATGLLLGALPPLALHSLAAALARLDRARRAPRWQRAREAWQLAFASPPHSPAPALDAGQPQAQLAGQAGQLAGLAHPRAEVERARWRAGGGARAWPGPTGL